MKFGWRIRDENQVTHNTEETSVDTIRKQLREPRPLPMGVKQFHEWSDRIISGALIPGATAQSQKFALADMILHLGPTEDHKEDVFFIKTLRKTAINQVADAMRQEIRTEVKARIAKEEEEAKLKLVQTNPAGADENKVLADTGIQGT